MKWHLLIFILFNINGCFSQDSSTKTQEICSIEIHPLELEQNIEAKQISMRDLWLEEESYDFVKRSIANEKKAILNDEWDTESVSKQFTTALLERIIPYWEGTPWTFEGHTSVPNKGSIACGYFVSTTLRDVGLNLNRYKLAQQSPLIEAKSLALNTDIYVVSEGTNIGNIQWIENKLKE